MSNDSSPRSLDAAVAIIETDTVNGTVDDANNGIHDNGDDNENQVGHNNNHFAPHVETRTVSDSETEDLSEGLTMSETEEDETSIETTSYSNEIIIMNQNNYYNFEDNGNSMVGFHDSSTSNDDTNDNDDDDDYDQLHNDMQHEMDDFLHYVQQIDDEELVTAANTAPNHTVSHSAWPNQRAGYDYADPRMAAAVRNAVYVEPHYNGDGDGDLSGYTVGGYNSEIIYDDNDDDDDDDVYSDLDDDDDDYDPCNCPNCLLRRITRDEEPNTSNREDHLCDEFFERPLHPDASPCAICMEPETTSRRFVHLPCCSPVLIGTSADMDPSSTRFCQKCLTRCLITTGCAVPNKCPTCQKGAQLMGQCPRCKQLLVLNDLEPDDECKVPPTSIDIDNSTKIVPLYKRTRVALPTTEALFWYTARNGKTVGVEYRPFLLTLAVCPNPHFIPEELLFQNSKSPERLWMLCQWGLIRKQTTTREWLQRKYKMGTALEKFGSVSLEHLQGMLLFLWKGIEWMAGAKLESAKNRASNWRVSKLLLYMHQSIQEQSKHEGSNVYCMDPNVHSELRSLVFRHLHCFNKDEWEDLLEFDCEEYDRKDEEDAIKLLPPLMRKVTQKEQDDIDDLLWRNCRHHCLLQAWDAFCAAHRAFRRLSLVRGLWLTNLALSLTLLSSNYLGLPPISDWPALKPNASLARWRWHLLTLLNVILVKIAFGLVVKLLDVVADVLLGILICIHYGKIIEAWTPQKGKREKKEWIISSRLFGGVFGFCYFGCKAYVAWKDSTLEGTVNSGD